MLTLSSSRSTRLEIESSKNFPKCGKSSFLAPLELEPDDLFEVVLAAAADDARLVLRRDRDGEVGREALRRHGPHHVRVEQVLMNEVGGILESQSQTAIVQFRMMMQLMQG